MTRLNANKLTGLFINILFFSISVYAMENGAPFNISQKESSWPTTNKNFQFIATKDGIVCMISDSKNETGVQVEKHPFFGNVMLPREHKRNFLTTFDPVIKAFPMERIHMKLQKFFNLQILQSLIMRNS